MARHGRRVTWSKDNGCRIPDFLSEGVALMLVLERRGLLPVLGERIRIRREGGYSGFDVLLFLLLFFASRPGVGIKRFWELVRPHARQLAAAADRKLLPSPASMSRALDAVESELLRPQTAWLLSEGAGIDLVLRHPSVQTYDSRGEGWHVFDFDPTVTSLRHRALPEGDDMPSASRRSALTAAPGYSGRKRGDVQFRQARLQHAGSSAWLYVMLAPGNGDGRGEIEAAANVVVETCTRLGHPLSRAVLRSDGAFGWVPHLTACRERNVPFITRLTRPGILDLPEVRGALCDGIWHLVPDALSGPRRGALDLGVVTIPPGDDTQRKDGSHYDPVSVRVVVSRFPREGKADHGRLMDGWQYELYAVDVSAEALPAADAVAMYYGRAAQENRFAQEDREVGLDRIFSYNLLGQEFAAVAGLWAWNLRLALGFEMQPPPAVRPEQESFVALVDSRVVRVAGSAGSDAAPATAAAEPPREQTQPPGAEPITETALHTSTGCTIAEGPHVPPPPRAETVFEPEQVAAPPTHSGSAEAAAPGHDIVSVLGGVDWPLVLQNRPGWSWNSATGHLRCPEGRELALTTVRKGERAPGLTRIIFRRPSNGCEACESRPDCNSSNRSASPKHFEVSVATPTAARLRELLRGRPRSHRSKPTQMNAVPERSVPKPTSRYSITPLPPSAPAFRVTTSRFLPARARRLMVDAVVGGSFRVRVTEPPPRPPRPVLLADSDGDRQHRRLTWKQHFARNAIDPSTEVQIDVSGSTALRKLLGAPGRRVAA